MADKTAFTTGPKPAARKPDYYIRAKPRTYEGLGGKVGVAWINDDKSITIKLETCTALFGNDDLLIRMFPAEQVKAPVTQKNPPYASTGGSGPFGYTEDGDRPF